MGQRLDERELRARAIGGVREQVEAFGSAHSERLGFRDLGFLEMWELRR
jgi:hypothetical protein